MPLLVEAFQVLIKGSRDCTQSRGQGRVMPFSESDRNYKFPVVADVDLAGQRDISVGRGTELPVHFEVVHQVLPAVAPADKAATSASEATTRRHDQRDRMLGCQQYQLA